MADARRRGRPSARLVVLLAMALIVGGVLTDGGRRGALLGCGFALVSLAGLEARAARYQVSLALDAAGGGRTIVSTRRSSCGPTCRRSRLAVGVGVFVLVLMRLRRTFRAPRAKSSSAYDRSAAARAAAHAPIGLHHVTVICSACGAPRPSRDLLGLALDETVNDDDDAPLLVRRRARHGGHAAVMEYRWSPGRSAWAPCTTWPCRWPNRGGSSLAGLPALALGGLHRRVRPRRPAVDLPARPRRDHHRDRHGLGLTDPPQRGVPVSPLPRCSSQPTPTRTGVRLSARSVAGCVAPLVLSICASA